MGKWYSFKSKDGQVRGYGLAKNEVGVAHFAGYPPKDLVIERVRWNGREFVRDRRVAKELDDIKSMREASRIKG